MINQESKSPRVIAVTGGKGGVGKTSIAINLAIALSRTGSKVCLFDGDTSLANINIMLGLYPAYTLEHLLSGERSIQDIVLSGPAGIQIIPGASGVAQCVELDVGQQQRLVTSIRAIEKYYDYFLVDTAAGIGPTVLHFIAAAQVALIVITPEATSLTDAFSLLKVLKRRGYRRTAQIVVNMAANPSQAKKVYIRFSRAVGKYLELATEYLGCVWMDESMRNALTTQKPVALFPKTDPSARCFYRLAESLDDVFERPGTPNLPFSAYWQKVAEYQHVSKAKDKPSGLHASNEQRLTQVQKQLLAKAKVASEQVNQGLHDEAITVASHEPVGAPAVARQMPLNVANEREWQDLRLRMSRFMDAPNITPEQVLTLFSSVLYSYGDRLGHAAVDLVHGLLHALQAEGLSDEQKQLLLSDYERLGLDEFKQAQEKRLKKVRYDAEGFGDQQALVHAIRSASADVPLESLLESIKYASLVDSRSKEFVLSNQPDS